MFATAGLVNGLPLEARGQLLHADADTEEQPAEEQQPQRMIVRLPGIRDWVVDHSHPPALWLITDVAWYRYNPSWLVFSMPRSLAHCTRTWAPFVHKIHPCRSLTPKLSGAGSSGRGRVSSNCRCRLCSPALEYAEAFGPAQQLLTMAALGGQLLSITVSIDYSQALAALLRVRQQ